MFDHRYQQLTFVPGLSYDTPWSAGSPLLDEETLPAGRTAGSGWRRVEHGPWVYLLPGPLSATEGWKVHVASLPADAADVVGRCWEVCREFEVPVKALRSRGLVLASQQKYADPAASGKVVTCYPRPDQLRKLCEGLAGGLRGRAAPRVLGELRVPDAPVYLRYGAFREQWTTFGDGRAVPARGDGLRPDVRGRRSGDPEPDEPAYVAELRAAAEATDAGQKLDFADIALVHRSNAGGVYRALRADGRTVLLKEARHHAGLDAGGTDARARLRHEWAALERLAGSAVAPEPLDYLTVGDSDFLVMSWIEGCSLAGSISRRHPVVRAEPAAGPAAGYLAWVDRVVADTGAALARLHARGIVHRDVQPANLIDTGERVVVIDLESCAIDGVAISRGVATAGFSTDCADIAPENDRASLRRVHSMLVNPMTPLLQVRPDLERHLWRVGSADLGVAQAPEPTPAPLPEALVDGLRALAAPGRDDRLFPGDVEQFAAPRGGLGLLYGAAGILLTLSRRGHDLDPVWLEWLVRRALAAGPFPRGFGAGAEGVAWCLAHLGELAAAEQVLDRFVLGAEVARPAQTPWWQHGSAGRALALADLGQALGRADVLRLAVAEAEQAVAAVRSADTPAGYRPGLCHGWSGVGLALLGLRALVDLGDSAAVAQVALDREMAASRLRGACLLTREGPTLLPYLGRGCAALGLLAARLRREPRLPLSRDTALAQTVTAVRETCSQPVSIFAGLLTGRAGLLCVLDALTDGRHPAIAEHRSRLAWHTIERRTATGEPWLGALGDHNLRCSTDLATGTAGMLVALAPRPGTLLPALLGLERTHVGPVS